MSKIFELMSVKSFDKISEKWMKFALYLRMSNDDAMRLYQAYGRGYIYSSRGIVIHDTKANRRRAEKAFGDVVIVDSRGRMWLRQKGDYLKQKADIESRCRLYENECEQAKKRKEEEERKKDVFRFVEDIETMFELGKGIPTIKHGGRGVEADDIGRFVNPLYDAPSMNDYDKEPCPVIRRKRPRITTRPSVCK